MDKRENNIINQVCKYYKIEESVLFSRNRTPEVAIPRQITQYLLKKELRLTYKNIGDLFNRRHNTVIYAYNTIESQLTNKSDTTIKEDISILEKLINS